MRFSLTWPSANKKTGPIATSMTSRESCPPDCALMGNGCYAEAGPLSWVWAKASMNFPAFLRALRNLPRHVMFRHNVAGDLVGNGERVDLQRLLQIHEACEHLGPCWTYSHKRNQRAIENIKKGQGKLVINLSADNMQEADELARHGLPVVCILPEGYKHSKAATTPAGRMVVVCPASIEGRDTTCSTCAGGNPLCAQRNRSYIIGFPAHGTSRRKVNRIAMAEAP